jgi:eukaryotic-like serine/threonine-protein kinase
MASEPATARRLEPQNRIGSKYRLRRRIAVGGMGEIWVARNEATGADVALKVLRPDSDKSNQAAARFRNEARLAAMLSHRSIIRVFDLLEEEGQTLVLVMELLRGETLQVYLERKGPRPAKEAVAILTPILSALEHAHELGVVHRDVTPSNIFLTVDPDGHVTPKLVDFGIAKLPGAPRSSGQTAKVGAIQPVQTLEGRVLGTPRYMSPEQIRSQDVDGRSDLFSVGVVLYEMLTGVQPFAASTPSASLAAVLEAQVDPDPRIDPKLWFEIQRAIAKRPYERHASAQEMATALRDAVGETDGALEATLKRTRPPVANDEANDIEPTRSATPTIEGQSVALSLPGRRFGWAPWALAGVLLGILGVAALASMRSTPAAAPALTPSPPASTSSRIPPPPPPEATASAAPLAPSPSPPAAATTATARPAHGQPHSPAAPATRTRPVATTPGF